MTTTAPAPAPLPAPTPPVAAQATVSAAIPLSSDLDRNVRRSILALVLTACAAFAIVATGSVAIAHRVAREQALAEAVRAGVAIGNAVFGREVSALQHHDPTAMSELDMAADEAKTDASVVRIKVWSATGQVLYSDDHRQIGKTFPITDEVRSSVVDHQGTAIVTEEAAPDSLAESRKFGRLVEVHLPLQLADGTTVAFEVYSTDKWLRDSEHRLTMSIVPLALGGLLLLMLLQLPAGVWLVRRAGRAQAERARLLTTAVAVSTRDRRTIAGDLHDGVIQDLAGVGYVLGAAARKVGSDSGSGDLARMLASSGSAVQRAVRDLRSLVVEIRPPDLTADGVSAALADLAERLESAHGLQVDVRVALPDDLAPAVIATVYRCAREAMANIVKHAAARSAVVTADADSTRVQLTVTDDGRGLPPGGFDRRAEGHVGLTLLGDAARDLGGVLTIGPAELGGTRLHIELPRRIGKNL